MKVAIVLVAAAVLATVAEHSPCSFRAQTGGSEDENRLCEGIERMGPPALIAGNVGAAVGAARASQGGSGDSPGSPLLLIQKPASSS
jgi:hypothetical protein